MNAIMPIKVLSVLVVDACEDTADSLALLVHTWGHHAHIAHNFQEALRQAADICPDVVFLDIVHPGKKGWEVIQQMRQLPELSHSYLVAVTGWPHEGDRDLALDAGCDRYFIKPADPRALQGILSSLQEDVQTHDS